MIEQTNPCECTQFLLGFIYAHAHSESATKLITTTARQRAGLHYRDDNTPNSDCPSVKTTGLDLNI